MPPQPQGSVSAGVAYVPILDAKKRPITAGGFVDSGPIIFQDVAEKACRRRAGTTFISPADSVPYGDFYLAGQVQ
jgi:hypothetical protein